MASNTAKQKQTCSGVKICRKMLWWCSDSSLCSSRRFERSWFSFSRNFTALSEGLSLVSKPVIFCWAAMSWAMTCIFNVCLSEYILHTFTILWSSVLASMFCLQSLPPPPLPPLPFPLSFWAHGPCGSQGEARFNHSMQSRWIRICKLMWEPDHSVLRPLVSLGASWQAKTIGVYLPSRCSTDVRIDRMPWICLSDRWSPWASFAYLSIPPCLIRSSSLPGENCLSSEISML